MAVGLRDLCNVLRVDAGGYAIKRRQRNGTSHVNALSRTRSKLEATSDGCHAVPHVDDARAQTRQ
jgi:hypothetical protein